MGYANIFPAGDKLVKTLRCIMLCLPRLPWGSCRAFCEAERVNAKFHAMNNSPRGGKDKNEKVCEATLHTPFLFFKLDSCLKKPTPWTCHLKALYKITRWEMIFSKELQQTSCPSLNILLIIPQLRIQACTLKPGQLPCNSLTYIGLISPII